MATKKIENVVEDKPVSLEEAELDYIKAHALRESARRSKIAEMQTMLNEQFPKEVERQLKKSGTYLTYIPVSEIINRLNKVLGFDGWSYEIIKCERDALDPEFIVAHVRMSLTSVDSFAPVITRDGFGGQKIKRTKTGEIVDLGDEFKGAVSDALKKAAQSLGVGLYLARTEEAMEAEAEAMIDPQIESLWNQFIELSRNLSPEAKTELGTFWNSHAGNRPKPTLQTAKAEDLEALIAKCVSMSLRSDM